MHTYASTMRWCNYRAYTSINQIIHLDKFVLSCKPMHINQPSVATTMTPWPTVVPLQRSTSCNSGTGVFTSSHSARLILRDCCDCRYPPWNYHSPSKKWWLEDEFPFGMAYFQGQTVSFRENYVSWTNLQTGLDIIVFTFVSKIWVIFEFWLIAMDHTYFARFLSSIFFGFQKSLGASHKFGAPNPLDQKKKSPHMSYLKPGPPHVTAEPPKEHGKIRFEQIHVSKDMRCNDYVMSDRSSAMNKFHHASPRSFGGSQGKQNHSTRVVSLKNW